MSTDDQKPVRSILLVDDDPLGRELAVRCLARTGHRVVAARDGAEALALLEVDRYDLMLLDVFMPRMDGFEVLPRALALDPDMGIVMLSGLDDPSAEALSLKLGALAFVTKPVSLAPMVEHYLLGRDLNLACFRPSRHPIAAMSVTRRAEASRTPAA